MSKARRHPIGSTQEHGRRLRGDWTFGRGLNRLKGLTKGGFCKALFVGNLSCLSYPIFQSVLDYEDTNFCVVETVFENPIYFGIPV